MTRAVAMKIGGAVRRLPGQQVQDALRAEAGRVQAMLVQATPPDSVGPVPVAPARGPQRVVTDWAALPGGMRRALGRRLEEADVFDVMHAQALRRHGGSDAAFEAPFTPGQVAMARHYRGLTERRAAGGVRCASLEAGRGGGSGGEFMDAFLAVGRELDALHARIGGGVSLTLRRVRPSDRGSRISITDRRLVDMVCLAGLTFDAVLQGHGWVIKGEHRQSLRTALVGALDRMQGYGGRVPPK